MQKVYVLCAPNNKIIWGSGQNWLVNDFPKLHHAFFSKKKKPFTQKFTLDIKWSK